MNKTPIEWCDWTWNPITGCLHSCAFCYARRFAKRGMGRYNSTGFEPYFHPDRLNEPDEVKKPSRIFVGSMSDIGGKWGYDIYVPAGLKSWYSMGDTATSKHIFGAILDTINRNPQHAFIVLTKNPANLGEIIKEVGRILPDNLQIGTSITGPSDLHRVSDLVRVVSWEPALEAIDFGDTAELYYRKARGDTRYYTGLKGIDWLIIGLQTGPGAPKPTPELLESIRWAVAYCKAVGVPVFLKNSLAPYWTGDLPQQLKGE